MVRINDNELCYWMALAHLEGMHTSAKMKIVVSCFERKEQLSSFFKATDAQKLAEYKCDSSKLDAINQCAALIPNYAFMAESLIEQGYGIISIWDDRYPETLKKNMKYNAPLVIYTKGDAGLLSKPAVAVVGSRKAGAQALAFTDVISRQQAAAGNVVVSGYAKGVDRQALESAVAANGYSIVVLPQGITTFSSGYKHLYKHIVNGHVLIMSYFYPEAGWSVGLAMARNSVVYAMAHKIYVAESDSKGGTWNGVMTGLDRQRNNGDDISIYVRVPDEGERNANKELIAAGAKAVDSNGKEVAAADAVDSLNQITDETLKLLQGHELRLEDVVASLGLNWAKDKTRHFLDSLSSKGVRKLRKGRSNVYTLPCAERSLFS